MVSRRVFFLFFRLAAWNGIINEGMVLGSNPGGYHFLFFFSLSFFGASSGALLSNYVGSFALQQAPYLISAFGLSPPVRFHCLGIYGFPSTSNTFTLNVTETATTHLLVTATSTRSMKCRHSITEEGVRFSHREKPQPGTFTCSLPKSISCRTR